MTILPELHNIPERGSGRKGRLSSRNGRRLAAAAAVAGMLGGAACELRAEMTSAERRVYEHFSGNIGVANEMERVMRHLSQPARSRPEWKPEPPEELQRKAETRYRGLNSMVRAAGSQVPRSGGKALDRLVRLSGEGSSPIVSNAKEMGHDKTESELVRLGVLVKEDILKGPSGIKRDAPLGELGKSAVNQSHELLALADSMGNLLGRLGKDVAPDSDRGKIFETLKSATDLLVTQTNRTDSSKLNSAAAHRSAGVNGSAAARPAVAARRPSPAPPTTRRVASA